MAEPEASLPWIRSCETDNSACRNTVGTWVATGHCVRGGRDMRAFYTCAKQRITANEKLILTRLVALIEFQLKTADGSISSLI